MKKILSIPSGTEDVHGRKMLQREAVLSVIKQTYESYGFEPLHTPSIEYSDVFNGHHGEGEKIQFHFTDKRSRILVLRYDLTVPLARFVAMHPEIPRPFKRYQIGPSFRDDSVDHGHHREFIQCDADVIGDDNLAADADVIMMAIDGLEKLGLRNFRIRINHRGIIRGIADFSCGFGSDILILQRALDHADKYIRKGIGGVKENLLGKGLSSKQVNNLLGWLKIKGTSSDVLNELSRIFVGHYWARRAVNDLQAILGYLPESYKKYVSVDLALARGADYYTGFIIEGFMPDIPIGAMLGGGRYDDLLEKFSGKKESAVGMAFGLERIMNVMSQLKIDIDRKIDTLLIHTTTPDLLGEAGLVANTLRKAGLNVDFCHTIYSLNTAKNYAIKRGYSAVITCEGNRKSKVFGLDKNSKQVLELCGRLLH